MRTRGSRSERLDREESGNISVVTIGFLAVVGLLVVVVVNTSAVFLAHRQLANLADSIALAAADVVDENYYQSRADVSDVQIDESRARSDAQARLNPDTSLALSVSGDEVVVRLERTVDLWLVPGMRPQTRVVAEARAQIAVLLPAALAP